MRTIIEDMDKSSQKITIPAVSSRRPQDCILEEENASSEEHIPGSSLPTKLSPLSRASFEELAIKVDGGNPFFPKAAKTSFEYQTEIRDNYTQSAYESSESNTSSHEQLADGVTGTTNSGHGATKLARKVSSTKNQPALATQVSFCQSPPIEHEYPPPAPRRHFTFGARTYSEEEKAKSQYNRRHQFSRQKTVR